jgi:hypothetical protein
MSPAMIMIEKTLLPILLTGKLMSDYFCLFFEANFVKLAYVTRRDMALNA